MADWTRDAGAGLSTGFIGVGKRSRTRRRARKLPVWLRLATILGCTAALWALIFAAVHWLFSL